MENQIDNILRDFESKLIDRQEAKRKIFIVVEERVKEEMSNIEELLPLIHGGLPDECVRGWDEVKFCDVRQGDGNMCKLCSHLDRF